MTQAIVRSLILSLGLTLVFESAAAWLLGMRKGKDFLLLLLVNVFTNPLLGLILDLYWLRFGVLPGLWLILPLEVLVVAAEGALYRGRLAFRNVNPFVLSLILNGLSYFGGLMIS